MVVKKETFSIEGMEKIRQYLDFYNKQNSPVDYEVLVDKFKAVRRTNDPVHFDNYKKYMEDNSSLITIRLYIGRSNSCDKILFSIQPKD